MIFCMFSSKDCWDATVVGCTTTLGAPLSSGGLFCGVAGTNGVLGFVSGPAGLAGIVVVWLDWGCVD